MAWQYLKIMKKQQGIKTIIIAIINTLTGFYI